MTIPTPTLVTEDTTHPAAEALIDRWEQDAACRNIDPAVFFPERGDKGRTHVATAKNICASCPVTGACLDAHIDEKFGVWGGLTESERRRERRRRGGLAGTTRGAINHGTKGGHRAHLRRGEAACPECAEAARVAKRARKRQ